MKTPSLVLVVSVLIISFGVILSSVGEASFSFIGIVMMGLSIITEALRTTLAQVENLTEQRRGRRDENEKLAKVMSYCNLVF